MSSNVLKPPSVNRSSERRTRYPELAALLKRRIESGEFAPGDRLPTFARLSLEFDVAYNTLNNVVAALEKDGLVERKRGSGIYVTDPRERLPRTNLLGLVSMGVQMSGRSPIWAHLLDALRTTAMREEKRILLLEADSSLGWDQVEGVLVADWKFERATQHRPSHLPCVSLLYPAPDGATVMSDEISAGRLAAEHLLSLGHRRIGFLHLSGDEISIRRAAGYRGALHAAGVEPSPLWERHYLNLPKEELKSENAHSESALHAMSEWLRDDWQSTGCTALLCQNDDAALGAMAAMQEAGIQVPRDVSLIGFDGFETGVRSTPALSSVRLPVEQIAAMGIEILLRQLRSGENAPLSLTVTPELVVRASTASPVAAGAVI